RIYWWERVSLMVGLSKRTSAVMTYPHTMTLDLADPRVADKLNAVIKDTPANELDVDRYLDELGHALGVEWNREIEARYADHLIMTWDQVRALARAGMDVESHGRRHRVLQTLDGAALDDELAGARRDLEAELGRPVRAVAYPVGRRIHSEQHIRKALT